MTIVQESYHAPAPADKSDVLIPLPTGTIFMYGWSHKPLGTGNLAPACEPIHYWTDPDDLLEWVANDIGAKDHPKFLNTIALSSAKAEVYFCQSRINVDFYIYVWSVPPAPSRTNEVQG